MTGRYFYLQTELNGMVLDLSEHNASPGNQVWMWNYHGGDNQLWFHDIINNTIRTKQDGNFVLDINDDNRLVVNEFDYHAPHQRWIFHKNRVVNLENGKVLDIAGANDNEGAEVCQWDWKNEAHQRFSIHYVEPQEFLIRSTMNGKVMDVCHGDTDPGTCVTMYDEHRNDNQVWYEGRDGTIHTKLNGFVLSSDDDTFQIQPYDGTHMERAWIKLGSKIVNRYHPEKVADIEGSSDDNGAKITPYDFHGGDNQLWECVWLK